VGKQGLQHREALRRDRAGDTLECVALARLRLGRRLRRRTLVPVADEPECPGDLAPELRWRDRRGTAVLADDPRRELSGARVSGHDHAVVYVAVGAVRALDPPGGVVADLDLRLGDEIADLPGRPVAVALDLEIRRHAEVALAAGREPDVAPDAR